MMTADTDGEALVRELRAAANAANEHWLAKLDAEVERDRLAAANAALEAKVARLVELLQQHYDAQGDDLPPTRFNRLMRQTEVVLTEVQARDKGEGG